MATLEEIENDDALIAYINCYNIAVSYIDSTGAGSKYHRSEIHENIDYRQINAIVSAYNLKQTLKELSVRDDTKYTTENTAILVTEPGKYRLWNRTFLVGKDNYIPIAELTTLYQIRGTNSDSDDEDE
jgi:hypothetical protein